METIDERVETLEMTVARFITNTNAIIQRLDRTCERLDRSYEQVRQEMEKRDKQIEQRDKEIEQRDKQIEQRDKQIDHSLEQLKRDAREHALEMAHIADRIGRFAEDVVGPNIPRLAREAFGITEFALYAQRIKKWHATASNRLREFDFVIAGNRQLVITETKATARLKDVEEFADNLKEVFDFFPEYQGYVLVPIFASMAVGPDLLKRLTRLKIYALVLGERTMELLNLEEVRAKRR